MLDYKDDYKRAVELSLIASTALHAMESKFTEFTIEEINDLILGKLPSATSGIIPAEKFLQQTRKAVFEGESQGFFKLTTGSKFCLTLKGEVLASHWLINSISNSIDVSLN